ncbi:Maf1 regulator [Cooperia oncophora]
MVQSDKKQWKAYGGSNESNHANERQPLSPPDDFLSISASPIGHSARMRHLSEAGHSGSETDADDFVLLDSISKRTLFDLIGALNIAYPDYDFSDVVMEAVDNKFYATVNGYASIRDELWLAIDAEIQPNDCRIYSFKSNYADDPFSEDGCLWCLNFFFHNKSLKRLMMLSCRALSQNGVAGESLWDLDEE